MIELSIMDEMIISEYIKDANYRISNNYGIYCFYSCALFDIYIVRMRNNIEYQSKGEL